MNFVEAIREAHSRILRNDPSSLLMGLGVNYPNGADGSTKGLYQDYPNRVLDTPISELAVTGAAVGMASQGLRPIVHHGRIEFALLALDQILTQASRWNFMFGGTYSCPVVLRICIGRQWGNGPQHTANYHSIFLQSPGLDVYIPATPGDVYRALLVSSKSENPAVILEHRWLYKTDENIDLENEVVRFPFASVYGGGNAYTILTYADGLVDSLRVMEFCSEKGIFGSVVCLKHFPANERFPMILSDLVKGAKNLIVVDPAPFEFGLLSGVLSQLSVKGALASIKEIRVVSPAFEACPTSPKLVGDYYPNPEKIVAELVALGYGLGEFPQLSFDELHLPPAFDYSRHNAKDLFGS